MDEATRKYGELQMTLLRHELQNLKTCQFAFLTAAFTATGLLLGILPKLLESGFSSFGFLTPLVVVLPCSCFFFDKARTITRIVGYYQVLEKLLTPSGFPSWETGLSISRSEFGVKCRITCFGRVMLMRQPHGYWSLAYYTFLALSILCLGGAWKLALSDAHLSAFRWHILVFASLLSLGCLCRNLYLIWELTVGRSSYDANYKKWLKRLGLATEQMQDEKFEPTPACYRCYHAET